MLVGVLPPALFPLGVFPGESLVTAALGGGSRSAFGAAVLLFVPDDGALMLGVAWPVVGG